MCSYRKGRDNASRKVRFPAVDSSMYQQYPLRGEHCVVDISTQYLLGKFKDLEGFAFPTSLSSEGEGLVRLVAVFQKTDGTSRVSLPCASGWRYPVFTVHTDNIQYMAPVS